MNARNRLVHAALAVGLTAGALVASAPAANAATPLCFTGVMGVLEDGSLVKRNISATVMKSERKTAGSLPFAVSNIMWFDSVKVNGGFVNHIETIVPGSRPRRVTVRDIEASANLTASETSAYRYSFSPRLVTQSGRYYVYAVDAAGDLKRWTRYKNGVGLFYYGDPKVVAHNMSGLRTLSYSWTYQIAGKYVDFLYATTASGALRQIRIPWSSPGTETVKTLATSGYQSITGLSLSMCNKSDNYLSVIAIDKVAGTARWITMPYISAPKTTNVVDRGLVAPEADWHLHATT